MYNNLVTIYTIAYNEEFFLPYFIKHYRTAFPDCKIVIYDNMSTDNTVAIGMENGCDIIPYNTNGELKDSEYLNIKNNCWRTSLTPFVIVCDVDELLQINQDQLIMESARGTTIIKAEGWNMCNVEGFKDGFERITNGIRATQYDKCVCFNKKEVYRINYTPGCHSCNPEGIVVQYNNFPYKLLHMKFLNEDYMVERYKIFNSRMSDENRRNSWGIQYINSEEVIRRDYQNHLKASIDIYE
jgi:hypothetical protein